MDKASQPIYKRVLLKLSGEALQSNHSSFDPKKLIQFCSEIQTILTLGTEVALVIGGGNIIRGAGSTNIDRVTADQMGMLATVINGLVFRDTFLKQGVPSQVFSALAVPGIVNFYDRLRAKEALEKGQVVIFVGGTGNPLVTTDSAAALRGIEIGADIVLKATKVDGVYAEDPAKNAEAQRYTHLSYEEVVKKRLEVMDLNAILLCKDHNLPLRVFNMNQPGALKEIILGQPVGTQITAGE